MNRQIEIIPKPRGKRKLRALKRKLDYAETNARLQRILKQQGNLPK